MSRTQTVYQVFLASPGGLDEERQVVRDIVAEYNEMESHPADVSFVVRVWEDVPANSGRPQNLINPLVRDCDIFVLIIGDHWGSPTFPGPNSPYSSGTEEEFELAKQCLADPGHPLKRIAVFFKGISPERMAEPDAQLARVIEFRRAIEADKMCLYETFDEKRALERAIRRQLSVWLRAHRTQGGATLGKPERTPSDFPLRSVSGNQGPTPLLDPETKDLIQEAERLASLGRLVDAELRFAQAIARGPSIAALNQFGIFLFRAGRLSQAAAMFERVREQAIAASRRDALAASCMNRGWVALSRVDLPNAESAFREAQDVFREEDDLRGQAGSLCAIGTVLRYQGKLKDALAVLDSSRQLADRIKWTQGLANALGELGTVYFDLGRFDEALLAQEGCLELNRKIENVEGILVAEGNLGIIFRSRGIYGAAESRYRSQLAEAERLSRYDIMASAKSNLGIVAVETGRYAEADTWLLEAISIAKAYGFSDITTDALGNLSSLRRLQGRFDEALSLQKESLDLNLLVGRREALSNGWSHLGEIHIARGEIAEAEKAFTRALEEAMNSGDPCAEADAILGSARVAIEAGDLEGAERRVLGALMANKKLGRHWQTIAATANLGFLRIAQGRPDLAIPEFRAARVLANSTGNSTIVAQICLDLGVALFSSGQPMEAASEFQVAAAHFDSLGMRGQRARALLFLGQALGASGNLGTVEATLLEAREIAEECGDEAISCEADRLLKLLHDA